MGVAELLLKRKQELAARNLEEGAAYENTFRNETGVIELNEGVLYKVVKEGTGVKPAAGDRVCCHYCGANIKGEVFDSSYERGTPAEFSIAKLIRGWQLVMPLLSEGTKARLVIPSKLAYGEEQISKEIGPNSTLVFDVELLKVMR